ncbi:DUF6632 domain-containing protein [Duganella sp. Root1480D1]|uniref:DUF6632 domain-containing protein n=1 Tax=Duganella sp. Root1480D1 TaxID=1736471 RepID=UPI000A89CFEE|nr:DUF6632 domain-containing protein [Duganella sp. Root1480D1]
MRAEDRLKYLKVSLLVFGATFLFAVYPLTVLWPAGWAWHHGRSEYLEMIIAIYATLGIFLLLAARDPERHTSLIAFTIWSSIVHGAVMAVQAMGNPMHAGHLAGDVPALFIVAAVLGWLCPRALRAPFGN